MDQTIQYKNIKNMISILRNRVSPYRNPSFLVMVSIEFERNLFFSSVASINIKPNTFAN